MNQEQNQTKLNNTTLRYAGFGVRLGAYLLDILALIGKAALAFVILTLLNVIINLITGQRIEFLGTLRIILPILIIYLGIFVYRGRKDSKGSTFGRKKTNIIVLNEDGTNITTGKSFLRQLLCILLNGTGILTIINIILILTDEKKQTIADKILKTVVVYK